MLETFKSRPFHPEHFDRSGLYYKHVTIVNDDPSVISKWSFKLIDEPRVIIYDRHRFIIQATDAFNIKLFHSVSYKGRVFVIASHFWPSLPGLGCKSWIIFVFPFIFSHFTADPPRLHLLSLSFSHSLSLVRRLVFWSKYSQYFLKTTLFQIDAMTLYILTLRIMAFSITINKTWLSAQWHSG